MYSGPQPFSNSQKKSVCEKFYSKSAERLTMAQNTWKTKYTVLILLWRLYVH